MTRLAVLAISGAIAMTVGAANAQTDPQADRAAFAADISKLLAEWDSFVAIERIESGEDDKALARRYFHLVIDLYSERQVVEMITVGRFGLHYLLTQSRAYAGKDDEAAGWYKNLAQMTSFNLASNLWPGWGDEGVTISPEQQAFGYEMARLDLRLVEELKLGPDKLATATWIVGVHQVAAGLYAEGKTTLAKSREHAQESEAKETALMVEGYLAIAEILEGKHPDEGTKHLARTRQALEKLGTDDAKFFAKQHQDVLKLLQKH